MPPSDHEAIAPPGNLLPAQLGIVLVRRPILGHAAATLVSLAERGLLTITAPPESGTDETTHWRICTSAGPGAGPAAGFEEPLLDAFPPASEPLAFTEDAALDLHPALHKFGDGVVKDAVHHGWLRRLHHDLLTRAGEDLAIRAGNFRAALRKASAAGDQAVLADHLPYALTFGLVSPDNALAATLPLVRFAAFFVEACSDLPGWERPQPKRGLPGVPETDFSRDEWRGMPPGGRAIASMNNNTPGLPWP